VTGLVNTGGLQLNAFSFAPDRGIAVVSPSASGIPALSWSTGPEPKSESGVLQRVATPVDMPLPVAEDALLLGSEILNRFTDQPAVGKLLQGKL
jgi:hypothetical protein